MKISLFLSLAASLPLAPIAIAETPGEFLNRYEAEARQGEPTYAASPWRGEQFFRQVGVKDWSCSTCHTDNPAGPGRHATTAKAIDPLAPASNAARFTRAEKVEKWFKRNCNDVLGRACSPREKSDVLAYLITVKP